MTTATTAAFRSLIGDAEARAERRAPGEDLKVVLFSGGSGASSICESLLKSRHVSLTILINAYDDGHSTGRLRRFVPGMLGPSDVRKNISRIMPDSERCHHALRRFSDYRLPKHMPRDAALQLLSELRSGNPAGLPPPVRSEFGDLAVRHAVNIFRWCDHFYRYAQEQEARGRIFDYGDCAIGNLLFAGCFLEQERDFNRTVAEFGAAYEIRGALLNITKGENLFLIARKEDGSVLWGEADIVSTQNPARISELALIDGDAYLARIDGPEEAATPFDDMVREHSRTPEINPAAAQALESADMIIYGPGTQHSSLLPSYMTRGVGEQVAANTAAAKIWVANIRRDYDLPTEDASDLVAKFVQAMSRNGETDIGWKALADHFFLQRSSAERTSGPEYIPFDPARFAYPDHCVRLRDWESQEGIHSGGYVVNELQSIVQSRMDIVLDPLRHQVSIVVPVLNEAATISTVLKQLTALDMRQRLEISKEIIVVDGGSTDATYENARAFDGVTVLRAPPGSGRGAAMRMGIEHARGDIIVFFPGDLEYKVEDICRTVPYILRGEYKAVFGTRNVKVADYSARLASIYGNARGLYLMSKYGGMLLSMATLFLYNRYVSDPLTCLLAFDAALLRSLDLKSDGLGIHTEIVARLCRKNEYILEIPVDYTPRKRAEGKKTTPLDGFQAMLPLIRHKRGD